MKILITAIVLVSFGFMFGAQKIKKIEFNPSPVVPQKPVKEPELPFYGASVYELIQQPLGEVYEFLRGLERAGGNATEIFLVHSLAGNTFQPYIYNGEKFDLDKWNEEYWTYLRYFLYECKTLGIAPFIRVNDFCSIKRPECSKYYAFMNNIQGFTDVYDKGLYGHYLRLNMRLLKEISDAKIKKFFITCMNECDGDIIDVQRFNMFYSDWWQNNANIKVIISANPKHFEELEFLECLFEIHDIASIEDLKKAIKNYGENIFPNGDGCYGNGIASWNGYAEPSVKQVGELGIFIRKHNLLGYVYKLRSAYQEKGKINMSDLNFQALRVLVEE